MTLALGLSGCLASGLWFSASFPPLGLAPLAWIALVPFLLVTAGAGGVRGLWLGGTFGVFAALPQGAWLPGVAREAFGATGLGGIGLWLAASLAFVPAFVVLGGVIGTQRLRRARFPFVVALAWGLVELSHLELFPRIPWGALGATQIDTPVAPVGAWIGVHGVSGLIAFANALVAQTIARARMRRLGFTAAAGLAGVGLVLFVEARPREAPERSLRVVAVQPAVPMQTARGTPDAGGRLAVLLDQTRRAAGADLVVWPESSIAASLSGRPDLSRRIQARVDELGVPLLFGGFEIADGRRRNQAVFVAPGVAPRVVYEKRRPLILAEAVPGWLPAWMRRALGRLVPPLRLLPGREHDAELKQFGAPELSICYEAILSDFARDPEAGFLLNLVNDGWYDRTPAARTHLLLARWRAIEAGAPLLRVASTGITARVDLRGRLVRTLAVGEAGVLVETLPLSTRVTPFERLGYAPVYLAALVLVASFGFVSHR